MAVNTILFLAANPKNSDALRLGVECKRIRESINRLRKRDEIKIEQSWATTDNDLRRCLLEYRPEVVHFSGHGDSGGLAFEDDDGYPLLIRISALADLFKLCSAYVRCVVLNACFSHCQAEAIAKHIEFVIGMSDSIEDETAIKFSQGFYDCIAADGEFAQAFEFGCNAIDLRGLQGHQTPELFRRPTDTLPVPRNTQAGEIGNLELLYESVSSQADESRRRTEWNPQDIEAIRSEVWSNVNNLGQSQAVCPIDGIPLMVKLDRDECYDADISIFCKRHGRFRISKETDPLRPTFGTIKWKDSHVKGMTELALRGGYMVNCPACGTVVTAKEAAGFLILTCQRCGRHKMLNMFQY